MSVLSTSKGNLKMPKRFESCLRQLAASLPRPLITVPLPTRCRAARSDAIWRKNNHTAGSNQEIHNIDDQGKDGQVFEVDRGFVLSVPAAS